MRPMRLLRTLIWMGGVVALLGAAAYLTARYEVADRLTGLFVTTQSWLPLTLKVEQFLVVLVVASLLAACATVVVGLSIIGVLAARFAVARQQPLSQVAAAKRQIAHLEEEHARYLEGLISTAQNLAKRLDKRVVVQAIVEAASRVTSGGQANSIVSLWLLRFETDTLVFETGCSCDETLFAQTEFQPTEQPFAHVLSTQKPWALLAGARETTLVKREKLGQLGPATGLLVVPLVIEHSTLGVLVVFCHPDVLKGDADQRLRYGATWAELTLALAIAIQGEIAILDRLTGVHNREYFMKRLIQEIERSNRYQLPLSLLMLDIDNFKAVNDTLGHPQGDAVLRIIAKLIRKEVRAIDLVGRYGGEEFIILLPETGYGGPGASIPGALVVAERIRKAVDEEFRGLQKPLNLTVSVGVSIRRFPEDREVDYRELIRLADEQLYRAKTTGKNKTCLLVPDTPQEVR